MNNLKPMAESFFCRVRKSAFDTVEGCKDIVKDKIQEQSFKAASTIVLEPEATEIVNVLVKHLGMDKNKVVSDIIKEFAEIKKRAISTDRESKLLDSCTESSHSENVTDVAYDENNCTGDVTMSSNSSSSLLEEHSCENHNFPTMNYNDLPIDTLIPIVMKEIKEENSLDEIRSKLGIEEGYFEEIMYEIKYSSAGEVIYSENDCIESLSSSNEQIGEKIHIEDEEEIKVNILKCMSSNMNYFEIRKHLNLENYDDFEELYTQVFNMPSNEIEELLS